MNIVSKDFNRKLTLDERSFVSQAFPSSNPNGMKFLGERGEMIETTETSPELCAAFHCINKGAITKVYDAKKGTYLENIPSVFKANICSSPEYKCLDFNVYYATYNCIGWALGISKWLNPSEVTNNIKKHHMNHKQAIDSFLKKISNEYTSDHPGNFEDIVDKITTSVSKTNPVANNTVSFYFKGDECLHGSRYLETVNNKPLNQWTSKLGQELLLSHEENDLIGSDSLYGDTLHFAGIEKFVHDEL